jgi:hypothetical protein
MEKVVIPKFSSEAQEVAWWDTHRAEIEAELRRRISRSFDEVTKVSLASSNPAADNNGMSTVRQKEPRWL